VDRIELMLRSGVQSSLLFCVLLCGAFSLLTYHPRRVFLILASGSLFHLVLDVIQIKWGRGAFFLAPFDWRLVSLDLLWPDHPVFYVLTILSIVFVLATWRQIDHSPVFARVSVARQLVVVTFLLTYFAAPFSFSQVLFERDIYFARTLSDSAMRVGKPVAFDRASLGSHEDGRITVEAFNGEHLFLEEVAADPVGLISVRGVFIEPGVVRATSYHVHPANFRNAASFAGLLLVLILWGQSFYRWFKAR
jgi:signal transduction histidine kinase